MVYWTVACKGRTNAVFRQLNKELANNFSGGGTSQKGKLLYMRVFYAKI